MSHQKDAVKSGYWPLYRFHPSEIADGQPFQLDSQAPSMPVREFVCSRDPVRDARSGPSRAGRRPGRSWPRPTSTSAGTTTSSWPAWTARVPHVDRDAAAGRAVAATAAAPADDEEALRMTVDLRTDYLGLAPPLAARRVGLRRSPASVAMARRLEDAGVGAIVLPSLFEEEILNEEMELNRSLEARHRAVRRGARLLPRGRAIRRRRPTATCACLGGQAPGVRSRSSPASTRTSAGGWVAYARRIAGRRRRRPRAQRLPRGRRPATVGGRRRGGGRPGPDRRGPGRRRRSRSPSSSARSSARWPTSPPAWSTPGADGLVLFNRFYQPDLDLETLEVVRVELSRRWELRLPLRWIAVLRLTNKEQGNRRPRSSKQQDCGKPTEGRTMRDLRNHTTIQLHNPTNITNTKGEKGVHT